MIEATAQYPRMAEVGGAPRESRGILNSEMAAVIATSLALGADTIIESGRARGHSTLLLAKHLGASGIAVHSFDRSRDTDAVYAETKLAGLPNLHLHYGDSRLKIPEFVSRIDRGRVAVLIDGPKGKGAIDLFSDCLILNDRVVVGFAHDLWRAEGGTPSEGRWYAEQYFEQPFFTDDADYVHAFSHLDDASLAATQSEEGRRNRSDNGKPDQASYGPTLGVFIPSERDRQLARQRGLSTSGVRRLYLVFKDWMRASHSRRTTSPGFLD